MTEDQKFRARLICEHYHFLLNHIARLERSIETLAAPLEGAIRLLCTIPGIKERSAILILAEIGEDMSQFGSAKHLCCFCNYLLSKRLIITAARPI